MKLNKDVYEGHAKIMKWANESWFYGYHWSLDDQDKLEAAIAYFQYIQAELKRKLNQEGE